MVGRPIAARTSIAVTDGNNEGLEVGAGYRFNSETPSVSEDSEPTVARFARITQPAIDFQAQGVREAQCCFSPDIQTRLYAGGIF